MVDDGSVSVLFVFSKFAGFCVYDQHGFITRMTARCCADVFEWLMEMFLFCLVFKIRRFLCL